MKSFYIHRLGCPKNEVDADYLASFLTRQKLHPVPEPDQADLIIVNTCGFIQPAKEESIEAILSLAALKKTTPEKKLIITGCLSQRYAADLAREIPEADGIFGINSQTEIGDFIKIESHRLISPSKISRRYHEFAFPRMVTTDEPYAYIKISDGCDNRCSYCAIPDIRGPYRSRTIEAVVDEAEYLLGRGKKELILVSQESSFYGRDIYGAIRIIDLLEALAAIRGDFWIRVMYLHPARLDHDLIDYMIDNTKICSYFDISLQHINDRILGMMNRKVQRKQIENILDYIKARDAAAALRTSLIVGFPGETDKEYRELYDFVEERRFERLGTFTYSPEEGTPAEKWPGMAAEEVKLRRYDELMLLQQEIALERNRASIGQKMRVLVDKVDVNSGVSIGRSYADAPDIDQTVRLDFTDTGPGRFVETIITGADGYDLLGRRGVS